jgi:hypothetical protein
MIKLLPIFVFFSTVLFASDYPSCNVNVTTKHEIYPNEFAVIQLSVQGAPCYDADMILKISSADKTIYEYKAKFKPHVAIHWEDLTEQDVKSYAIRATKPFNIQSCSELEPLNNDVFDVYALVNAEQYQGYKQSNCKIFHHQIHYEASKTVILPKGLNKAILVNKFGV